MVKWETKSLVIDASLMVGVAANAAQALYLGNAWQCMWDEVMC